MMLLVLVRLYFWCTYIYAVTVCAFYDLFEVCNCDLCVLKCMCFLMLDAVYILSRCDVCFVKFQVCVVVVYLFRHAYFEY